jgi:hypothetical protein
MSLSTRALILSAAALAAASTAAAAQPLSIVNVSASAVNCVFNPACRITVTDSAGTIPIPGIAGTARLQSRTFTGAAGAPAAGRRGYMYRVNLTQSAGFTVPSCVSELRVDFGPVTQLNYNAAGPRDDVFVITTGGVGTIGLASANQAGRIITFTFSRPVCTGASVGRGSTSFFFGLASTRAPRAITAQAQVTPGTAWLSVPARAPSP